MLQTLFSLPIYKTNLNDTDINAVEIGKYLGTQFDSIVNNVELEKNGGVSTYSQNKCLHTLALFEKLNAVALYHANLYWKALDINDGLHPAIDECWSNKHVNGSYTDLHSHSLHPLVISFYLSAPPDCGGIVFSNPMEYAITHMPYNGKVEEKINTTVYVSTGDMLIFPGWLRHKTEVSHATDERIVITFNLRYEGRYLDSQQPYAKVQPVTVPDNLVDPVTIYSNSSEMDYLFKKLHTQEVIIQQLKNTLLGQNNGR
jgi:uncharacterized protein (TIGR02466 family)